MPPEDITHWIALSLVPGLGGESFRKLLGAFGEPEKIMAAGHAALAQFVRAPVAHAISDALDHPSVATSLEWLQDPNNHAVTLADADYPQALLETPDPPPLLYIKGRTELLNQPALAIVGSRNATAQGAKNAEAFAKTLSDSGLCILSGMALGIDAAAHRGGLAGASASIAVVGTGLDIVYPATNRELAHALAQHGALLSEFPLGTPSKAHNFPRRNRIISGMSHGCLVVEAALRSGSLITAKFAAEQGREVFAIPGSIHSPLSKGCHALIKQGAKLVESAQDVLEELHWPALNTASASAATPEQAVTDEASGLLKLLDFEPASIDALVERSGLTASAISAILLQLELDGYTASLPGGRYQRII